MLEDLYSLSQRYLESKYRPYNRNFTKAKNFLQHRLSVLVGQRGIGKTTIIAQFLLNKAKNNIHNREILYIPSDHFLIGNLSLYEIAENFVNHGGKIIAFDEIHKYRNWSKELKSIYDTFFDLHIISSGSSALEVHKGTHDLSRRAIIYSVSGLSFREYLEMRLNLSLNIYNLEEILNNHTKITSDLSKKFNLKHKNIF